MTNGGRSVVIGWNHSSRYKERPLECLERCTNNNDNDATNNIDNNNSNNNRVSSLLF